MLYNNFQNITVETLSDAKKYREDNWVNPEHYIALSIWYYQNNGFSKEISIDSFDKDDQISDLNLFTENPLDGEFNVFDWKTGERQNEKGEKLQDRIAKEPSLNPPGKRKKGRG